jgi:tetratricopeptide repeat protein
MKRPVTLSVVTLVTGLWATGALAHDETAGALGQVRFPTSCAAPAQPVFERGVALLHSFWYEEALKTFTSVTATDPGCAIGYWGIAMSVYYPLWQPPSEAMLARGRTALDKAATLTATPREKDYVAALATFYRDADKLDHRMRAVAYEKAMEQLAARYPEDREASVFYALALDATASPTDKTYANQLKAAVILEKVFAEQPNHPGVAHYLIHSYDVAPLATRSLTAARSYSKIAPAVPHALHMPSHIFTRLGLWQESIDSNLASTDAGKAYVAKQGGSHAWDQTLHAQDYLAYGYLQGGRDAAARRVVEEIAEYRKAEPESLAAAYALVAVPARYALERRSWTEAAALTMPSMTFPWARYPWAEAIIAYAHSLGAARTGNVVAAEKDVERLAVLRDALTQAKNPYWADQVEVQRRAAAAFVARAKGNTSEALTLLRSAADLETTMDKHPVTPAAVVPTRELLGDLLLDLNRPADALKEFESTLVSEPSRFRSLYGAARAAERAGDAARARTLYTNLVSLCGNADTERPELREAKVFLAK